MAQREVIFDVGPIDPCGCRWQLWAEDGSWHIGAACAKCQDKVLEMILKICPGLPVRNED
jgi:hypothetical protein